MTEPRETHGPDPRHPPTCQKYHDRPPCREGKHYNFCACDPCLYIRPGSARDTMFLINDPALPNAECSRCVPRALFVRFTPDDPYGPFGDYEGDEGDCCYDISELVWAQIDRTRGYITAYYQTVEFLNLSVRLTVGRFPDYGWEKDFDRNDPYSYGYCAWKIAITGSGVDYETEILMDPGGSEALQVPDVTFGPVEGPKDCTGTLSFVQFEKTKVAYRSRPQVTDDPFTGEYPAEKFVDLCPSECGDVLPDSLAVQTDYLTYNLIREYERVADIGGYAAYTYSDDDDSYTISWDSDQSCWVLENSAGELIATGGENPDCPLGTWTRDDEYDSDPFCVSAYDNPSFLCGSCTQACSVTCVSGNWRGNGWEFLEFKWFKDVVAVEHESVAIGLAVRQGWRYVDPVADPERIERLLLVDSGSDCTLVTDFTNQNLPTITIDSGCSCKLSETTYVVVGNTSYWYEVHCGFCSCYEFYCGSCRCVPSKICVQYGLDGDYSGPTVLSWNDCDKMWGDDYEDRLTIHLERGPSGECRMVPYWYGEALEFFAGVDGDGYDIMEPQFEVYDCQKELWPVHSPTGVRWGGRGKCMDSLADLIGFFKFGHLSRGGSVLWIHANSRTDDCRVEHCGFFYSHCPDVCMKRPDTIHVTVIGRVQGYMGEWIVLFTEEFEAHQIWDCTHFGVATVQFEGRTAIWTVKVGDLDGTTELTFVYWDGSTLHEIVAGEFGMDVSYCDPIYAATIWWPIEDTIFLQQSPIYLQIIITESTETA